MHWLRAVLKLYCFFFDSHVKIRMYSINRLSPYSFLWWLVSYIIIKNPQNLFIWRTVLCNENISLLHRVFFSNIFRIYSFRDYEKQRQNQCTVFFLTLMCLWYQHTFYCHCSRRAMHCTTLWANQQEWHWTFFSFINFVTLILFDVFWFCLYELHFCLVIFIYFLI